METRRPLAREAMAYVHYRRAEFLAAWALTSPPRRNPRSLRRQDRIIDFTLSNTLNSGIRRIGVTTQYSLIRHLQQEAVLPSGTE